MNHEEALNFRSQRQQRRLLLDSLLLGVVGSFSAQLFTFLLRWSQRFFLSWLAGYQPPGLPEEGGVSQQIIGPHGLLLIPLATALGGLLSGVLVYSFAPEAEGHGTDTAVKAFHHAGGLIRARVPLLKMVASALTIGSGGAAGREGPTALISAGIGSLYAVFSGYAEAERRLLVLIGMAAGLSAIFRSPIGTAFFAIEVLYSDMEFDAGALFYTTLASVVAYVVNGAFVGWQPIFRIPANIVAPHLADYAWYAALGIASGLLAALLPLVFYGIRDWFSALPVPTHFKPALGGLGVGLLAMAVPQVLGGGYGWIQEAIDGRLTVMLLLIVMFCKMVAFALTVSSGGSGGVFAPSLYIGAMLGGFFAGVFHLPSAPFVVVAMAAVFAGAARVPIATLLMVTEMTGGYHLLAPAALAVMLSYFVQSILSAHLKYHSLYESQVASRFDSPAHHAEYLRTSLSLLGQKPSTIQDRSSGLDLLALLTSGIPVDLPDGKQLVVLKPERDWVGKIIEPIPMTGEPDGMEKIVAIVRDGHMFPNLQATQLHPQDRLIAIVSRATSVNSDNPSGP